MQNVSTSNPRTRLVLQKLISQNNITASSEELDKNIEEYARMGVDLLLGNLRGEISAPRKLVYRFSAPDTAL